MKRRWLWLPALMAAFSRPAAAHGAGAGPGWAIDPWSLVPLAAALLLYLAGVTRLWTRAAAGRGISRRQVALFLGGWLILALDLLSPLAAWAKLEFAPHMAEHMVFMTLAAPLLVLARPMPALLWAFPRGGRRSLGGLGRSGWLRGFWAWLTGPLPAWTIHALLLWLWHLPVLFDAALESDALHAVQHATLLFAALVFWQSLLPALRRTDRQAIAIFSLFTTSIHSSLLGALMTFARAPWYAGYAASPGRDLTALEDQQVAGLIMWVPSGLVYVGAILAIIVAWLAQPRPAALGSGHAVEL